ncbi:ubiquitin-like domain-containing protein [Actinopolymorpha sp. B9G3]|uniref:ubiquitin-like domain-containing protein n=1 Tax=Actinopolymorpha sp. B9G3 TaxID=3158970 RepID=UPI0032D9319F
MHKKGLIGAVGIAVVGALGLSGAAYATLDKAVTVSVDGKDRTVHTFGSSVADVLQAAEIPVSDRDLVAPGPSTKITDGSRIAVRYSRPLTLMVDGRKQTHWVTALSVGEAFNDLGVRFAGAKMSASRSVGIGRKGLGVDVRTVKRIVVKHDGTRTGISAPVLTVEEALAAAKVKIDADDRIRPALSTMVDDGVTISINRIDTRTRQITVAIPYKTVRKEDSSMYDDQSKVERSGERGTKAQVVRIVYVDGKKASTKVLSQRVVSKPVDKVVVVGTKERPSGGGSVGGSVDSLNWAALADCESSGNPDAVNPAGYYGLYQFSLSTWESVGGSGNPVDNSSAEQTYRAKLLYQRSGAGQWPVCGSRLFS